MSTFTEYSDIIFNAYNLHSKTKEIVERKNEILDRITEYYNAGVESILFVGFNPAILAAKAKKISVTQVSDTVLTWLKQQNPSIELLDNVTEKFDMVVAFDEFLTFANTDDQQRDLINSLCNLSNGLVVTTVKDYKNQEFKDREYSQPAIIRSKEKMTAFTEIHDWQADDKNAWTTGVYELSSANSQCHGIYNRRALYFKQLAKFSMDAGATGFLVHRNLMYKSLLKKNYEHVISIHFEN